ncbi:MAG: ABC transporter permease [Planctomycetota bacterium]
MVLEEEILPYLQWLTGGPEGSIGAIPWFFVIVFALLVLGLLLGFAISAARHGPLGGGDRVYRTLTAGFREMTHLSGRRIWALARLAIKEALRRRVVVALIVFLVILLFASWFLKADHKDPTKLYMSFVLTATTYLMLGIALVLSAFSLPTDFKTKTIYTVVTKPVRSGEIVLGRILGFSLLGTVMLLIMALSSYVFVIRSLSHAHEIDAANLRRIEGPGGEVIGYEGRTTRDLYHRHTIDLGSEKSGTAIVENGHYHTIEGEDGPVVSSSQGLLRARQPLYGKLRYLDRKGVDKERGISVGSEWTYRSFIEGNSQAAAIWTFRGLDASQVIETESGEQLPVGLIVRVFKTHKGIIGKAITGGIQVRNPETGLTSELYPFEALDAQVDEQNIPRKLTSTENEPIDLFDDIVTEKGGRMELIVQCLERGQYFGFAQPDCYIRLPDASPAWNLVKVYSSIWVQMVIVVAIGVSASTLLNGPVAMLFTVSFILLGFFKDFFEGVATGTEYGGGPVESLYRLLTQKNIITDLDPGAGATFIQSVDSVLKLFMLAIAQVLPDFSSFSTVGFAAYGFNVPPDRVLQDLTICLAYVAGTAVVGYFLLRTREVAK